MEPRGERRLDGRDVLAVGAESLGSCPLPLGFAPFGARLVHIGDPADERPDRLVGTGRRRRGGSLRHRRTRLERRVELGGRHDEPSVPSRCSQPVLPAFGCAEPCRGLPSGYAALGGKRAFAFSRSVARLQSHS